MLPALVRACAKTMATRPNSYQYFACDLPPVADVGFVWPIISVLERMLAAVLLILCLPVLVLACMITCILSGESPLVAHRRIGKNGKPMWVYKVRTMWGHRKVRAISLKAVEYLSTPLVPKCKCRLDPRITSRFAAFCRKFSIDELPQLWLVARGEMSIVGPRPMTELELMTYYGPDTRRILQVKPGLTGLWQIRGRSNLSYHRRRRLDLFMLDKWSFGLYAAILIASVPKVVTGKDAC